MTKFSFQSFYRKNTGRGYLIPLSMKWSPNEIYQSIKKEQRTGGALLFLTQPRMNSLIKYLYIENGYLVKAIKSSYFSRYVSERLIEDLFVDRAYLYKLLEAQLESVTFMKEDIEIHVSAGGLISGNNEEEILKLQTILKN